MSSYFRMENVKLALVKGGTKRQAQKGRERGGKQAVSEILTLVSPC